MLRRPSIGIYGGGAWGLSLGLVFHRLNCLTGLFTSHASTIKTLKEHGTSDRLKEAEFPSNFPISDNAALPMQADVILLAGTLKALPEHCQRIAPFYKGQPVILCCKGRDPKSGEFPHESVARTIPDEQIFLLSGPSFAHDLVVGNMAAVSLAGAEITATSALASALNSTQLRFYASDDRIGVAVGGAYKNILAIASGIGHTLAIGESAKAAMITRGIVELQAISESFGGKKATLNGLSGLGDILLSCSSNESRNFRLGKLLGQGMNAEVAIKQIVTVAEGYYTAQSIPDVQKGRQLDLPISEMVYRVIFEGLAPESALQQLLSRPGGKREQG